MVDTISKEKKKKKICPTLNEKCSLSRCQGDVLETLLPLVAITSTSWDVGTIPEKEEDLEEESKYSWLRGWDFIVEYITLHKKTRIFKSTID